VVDFRPSNTLHLPTLYGRLEEMGSSIQVGEGDGVYRVHIHLLRTKRYEPIEMAEELGTVLNVHMENLLDQVDGLKPEALPLPLANVTPGQIAVLAVSPGPGLSTIMASLGAAGIITGGQTMNPSTQDMLDAIAALNTDQFILLPNNKNIILAAKQAAEMLAGHKRVVVVPSRTVPQGMAALFQHNADGKLEDVQAAMEKALTEIESGEVTTATRTVELDGVSVKTGQIIGLHNGALKVAGDDLAHTVMRLLDLMGVAQREIVTLYSGAEVTPPQANAMADAIRALYPNLTVETHSGGQPHYQYILSAE
jgi:dihydroxyacetone kinase-like predicted kinase